MNFDTLRDLLPLIGGGGALGILEALRRLWLNSRKSKLSDPDAFRLPQTPESTVIYQQDFPEIDHYLVGRDRDTNSLTRILQENPLVFVDGHSGVGKSTLLKLGVARRLMQTGAWLPIYVDIWGVDWSSGPQQALADAVQVALQNGLAEPDRERLALTGSVTAENLWPTLAGLRAASGRRPVIIFDQIDDYLNRHWQLFRGTDEALVSTADLLERNAFWCKIADLCRESTVHIAFAVRSDAAIGLNPFCFREPKPFPVLRLEPIDVRSLIANVVGTDTVAHPENGFEQLIERIAEDLQEHGTEPGVLPIRLRVVLYGLSALPRLTLMHLEKTGGIEGLESAYVDKHARKAPGGVSTVLSILRKLVTESADGARQTAVKTMAELDSDSQVPAGNLKSVLESLERAQIVRRRLDPDRGEVWQLYHDYLARGVVRLDRKDREGEILLAKSAKAFYRAASLWAKARTLLAPLDQLRLLREKVRGRLVYRPHRSYAVASVPRLFFNAPVLLVLLAFSGLFYAGQQHYHVVQQERKRLGENRWLDAQAALRKHDIASAVVAFGGAIDYLPASDPRASSALAGIVANIASAPRVLSDFGPVWGAALSVDADRVLVRRHTGRVEVFEGTTGRKLAAPDVGFLHNDFQWKKFLERYPVQLSDDGTVASLVYPAEAFQPGSERTRPWSFNLAVWRPGSDKLLWQSSGEDFYSVSHGPKGYMLVDAREHDVPTWPTPSVSTMILRTGHDPVETIRLEGGTIAAGFPPTGEPFIVWQTGGPEKSANRKSYPPEGFELEFSVVNVDKIMSGHAGPPPDDAILWRHTIHSFMGFQVLWQGYPNKPAFVVRKDAITWYCDSSLCKQVTRNQHSVLSYAEAPTKGVRVLEGEFAAALGVVGDKTWDDLEIGLDWARGGSTGIGRRFAQGPSAGTISIIWNNGLRVRDLFSGAERSPRSLHASLARAWNRDGSQLWTIDSDGRLMSIPIRGFPSPTRPTGRPEEEVYSVEASFRLEYERSLTIRRIRQTEGVELSSVPLGADSYNRQSWKKTIPGESWAISARFSRDGRYVIADDSHVSDELATGRVWILDADTGVERSNFETPGWILDGDVWIGADRRLAAVSEFPEDGGQIFAVCDWSETGLSRCSKPLETLARISRDGKYFIEHRPYTTAVYASSELGENQRPVLEVSGTRARERFNKALLEFLVSSSEYVSVSKGTNDTKLVAHRQGTAFIATHGDDGTFTVRVGERPLRYPQDAFTSEEGLWGPEIRRLAVSSDGRRMIVDRHHGRDVEIWDVETGTLLALLPMGGESVLFSNDDRTVQLRTEANSVDLLYLGNRDASPPAWASEAALSALVCGRVVGKWMGSKDVRQAIEAAAKAGDPVSKLISRPMSEAWSR